MTNQQGDLTVNAASLTCPGTIDVNTTTKATEAKPLSFNEMARTLCADVHRQAG